MLFVELDQDYYCKKSKMDSLHHQLKFENLEIFLLKINEIFNEKNFFFENYPKLCEDDIFFNLKNIF